MKKLKKKYKSEFAKYDELISGSSLSEIEQQRLKFIWLDYLVYLNKQANRDLIAKNLLQIVTIITSITIPIVSNLNETILMDSLKLGIITILGLISAFCVSFLYKFNLEERWSHYRKNAERVRVAGDRFIIKLINKKITESPNESLVDFLDIITNLKQSENDKYFEKQKKHSENNESNIQLGK